MPAPLHDALQFVRHLGWVWGLAIAAVATVATIGLAAIVAVRWPIDHFKGEHPRPFMEGRHPLLRGSAILGKNIGGVFLILIGIIMALPGVPGQGFLTILIGLTLVDFPGKRRLELWFIHRKAVLRAVNELRARFGHPALEID
ncbi:MAG TPA: hypothetical protein VGP07_09985 [Polyangia bacterium]|jgi:hypothetical protein